MSILDEGSLGSGSEMLEWVYTESFEIGDDLGMSSLRNWFCAEFVVDWFVDALGLRVRPASLAKCPRCWTFTKDEKQETCARCKEAIDSLE